ncbi:GAF domain-containing protein [Alicyclobacillus shizuokensis]|uniref:GAF domain-containing protein n=1 Tax=Alicyclobacillus shizuokensis TaxID=392014 RepID=UPI0008296642|nr:GAF domain-containing protein [Alicyclobacillus shizuokensis]MCL6627766.1 GAF domain-containing protein [Alicyclobacillus shizuokensis]
MFQEVKVDRSSKEAFYQDVVQQAKHLLAGESNWIANLSNLSALLNLHLQDINWVGFYLWSEGDGELVLGPFQGKPACVRIPHGKGVCGTAAARREPVVVEDVHAFPGHIACDAASRSEVVVPMLHRGQLLGVLDVDSPRTGRFDAQDAAGLARVVQVLLETVS